MKIPKHYNNDNGSLIIGIPLNGYENEYHITNSGRIYKNKNNKEVNYHISKYGYVIVNLTKNKKTKTEYLHRLVAKTFIDNIQKEKTVNHKDGNKLNNHTDNLEWLSIGDNIRHAFSNGITNNDHTKVKLMCVVTKRVYIGIRQACKDFEYSYSHLSKMIGGERINTTSLIRI